MLFMVIATFEPGKAQEMTKTAADARGPNPDAGLKVIGHWSDVAGNRGFRVVETDDPSSLFTSTLVPQRFAKIEIIPLIPIAEAWKLAGKIK